VKNITIIYVLFVVMVLSVVAGGLLVNCCSATDEEETTTTTEAVTTTEPTEPTTTTTETTTSETTTETKPATHEEIILHDTDLQVIDYMRLIDKSTKYKWYAYYIQSDGDLYVVTIRNNHVDVCCILN
jgi:ABC-type transport system substrate-binding protein